MSNSDLSVLGTHQRRCRIQAEWLGLIHSIAQYLFRRTTNPLSTKPWTMVLWPRSCVIFQIRLANWPEKVASTVCFRIRLLTRDQPRWAPNLFDWSTLNEDFLFTFYSVCQNPLLTILPLTWFRNVPPGLLNWDTAKTSIHSESVIPVAPRRPPFTTTSRICRYFRQGLSVCPSFYRLSECIRSLVPFKFSYTVTLFYPSVRRHTIPYLHHTRPTTTFLNVDLLIDTCSLIPSENPAVLK